MSLSRLPRSIDPDPEMLEVLRSAVSASERETVGVSDLWCSLRSWARRHGHGGPPTLAEAAQWIDGLAWDEWLRRVLPRGYLVLSRGKSYYTEGLRWSPDALLWHPVWGIGPVEFKHTRYSANKDVKEMDSFLAQLGLYCALASRLLERPATTGWLLLLHSHGDYKGARRPTLAAWRVEWTPDDLDAMLAEAKRRAERIAGDKQPPPDAAWPWLCRGCREGYAIGCPSWRPEEEETPNGRRKNGSSRAGRTSQRRS